MEILPLSDEGGFDQLVLEERLRKGVRLVSLFHTSNLDGRSLPVEEITELAHDRGAQVLFDGCQAAPHAPLELDRMGVDFYAVSGHKMLGPTGTGILAASPERLATLRPLLLGGETVEWSTLTEHELRPPPYRFEAGLQKLRGARRPGGRLPVLGTARPHGDAGPRTGTELPANKPHQQGTPISTPKPRRRRARRHAHR